MENRKMFIHICDACKRRTSIWAEEAFNLGNLDPKFCDSCNIEFSEEIIKLQERHREERETLYHDFVKNHKRCHESLENGDE